MEIELDKRRCAPGRANPRASAQTRRQNAKPITLARHEPRRINFNQPRGLANVRYDTATGQRAVIDSNSRSGERKIAPCLLESACTDPSVSDVFINKS